MSAAELEREKQAHLRHMTDGHWHDGCRWCRRRRVHGGNGLEAEPARVEVADHG